MEMKVYACDISTEMRSVDLSTEIRSVDLPSEMRFRREGYPTK